MSALVEVGALADRALGMLGAALVLGTALAAAAWLLSLTLLRRARPAVIAALWTVVLLKFVVPVGPGSRYSLASVIDGLTREPPPVAAVVVATAPPPGVRLAAPAAPTPPWGALALGAGWLAAVGALAARQVRRARAARARALAAAPAPAWLAVEAHAIARRLGLRRAIPVRVSPVDTAPYLVGLLRPIVVVPATLTTGAPAGVVAAADGTAGPDERAAARRAALAHELAHVRRADALVRVVQAAAATLFFFWPVVRLVNRRLDLAREQACDAWAVAVGPLSARDYARMLVGAARATATPAGGLALARRGGQLRRRVDALCHRPPGAGVGLAGGVAVASFAALGLAGAAPVAAPPAPPRICVFTPEVASSIMASFPEADADGDGALSRTEVCDFQQIMRRRLVAAPTTTAELTAAESEALASMLPELRDGGGALASSSLCCDCPDPYAPGGVSTREAVEVSASIPTCLRGVDP